MSQSIADSIKKHARSFKVPAYMVRAIIQVESAGSIYAWRAEPAYRYLVNVDTTAPFRKLTAAEIRSEKAPNDFPYFPAISSRDTEWWGQQCSWGLMQVMGAVAREYGFVAAFPKLCSEIGILYGCKHLRRLWDRFYREHGEDGVIAAYNAGIPRQYNGRYQNQGYVDKVRRIMETYP